MQRASIENEVNDVVEDRMKNGPSIKSKLQAAVFYGLDTKLDVEDDSCEASVPIRIGLCPVPSVRVGLEHSPGLVAY